MNRFGKNSNSRFGKPKPIFLEKIQIKSDKKDIDKERENAKKEKKEI